MTKKNKYKPLCRYKKCVRNATVTLGVIFTDDGGKSWPETVHLCEKHAKKLEKKLLTKLWREQDNEGPRLCYNIGKGAHYG